MTQVVLERISKAFGGVTANDGVDISVQRGTVHAILGENGAGKTTLMNILYGMVQPDDGQILIAGKAVRISSPAVAQSLGIGMIHQQFSLVQAFTVAENVLLGLRGSRFFVDLRRHSRQVAELSKSFGFDVDPHVPVWKLPIGMQQRVEVLKLLFRDADILILDEPTSVLTPQEVDGFFGVLRKLQLSGKTILLITHKLAEVKAIADRITVMRQGRVVCDVPASEVDADGLAQRMTGRLISKAVVKEPIAQKGVLLQAENVFARNDRGQIALDDMSLEVCRGEILGVAGVSGNGQTELAEVIAGLRPLVAGRVLLGGIDISKASARSRKHHMKVGYIPGDRHGVALLLNQGIRFNCVLRTFGQSPFSQRGLLDLPAIDAFGRGLVKKYGIQSQDIHQPVRYLSGGNQQKIVVARELEDAPQLLIVDQPCQGLDVGAVEFVHRCLVEQRNRGLAIVYISTELEDLISICDRIAVMYRGRIKGILPAGEASSERIGRFMAGLDEGEMER